MEDCRYLEIGVWKGSSLCAAMWKNEITCLAIDNWSEFGGPKSRFLYNFNKFKGNNNANINLNATPQHQPNQMNNNNQYNNYNNQYNNYNNYNNYNYNADNSMNNFINNINRNADFIPTNINPYDMYDLYNPIKEGNNFYDNRKTNQTNNQTMNKNPNIRPKSSTKIASSNQGQFYEEKHTYQVHTVQDYKKKYANDKKQNLGGLGANIGTTQWEEQHKKKQKIKEYSNNLTQNKKQKVVTLNNVEGRTITLINKNSKSTNNLITEDDELIVPNEKQLDLSNLVKENKENQLEDSLDAIDTKLDKEMAKTKKKEVVINPNDILDKIEKQENPKTNTKPKSSKDLKEILNVQVNDSIEDLDFDDKINNDSLTQIQTPNINKGYSHIQNVRNIKKQKLEEENLKRAATATVKRTQTENKKVEEFNKSKKDQKAGEQEVKKASMKSTKEQNIVNVKTKGSGSGANTTTTTVERPKSSTKPRPPTFSNKNSNKIDSSNIATNMNNYELESLLQNHKMYQDKLEKIRTFVNK